MRFAARLDGSLLGAFEMNPAYIPSAPCSRPDAMAHLRQERQRFKRALHRARRSNRWDSVSRIAWLERQLEKIEAAMGYLTG